MSGAIAIFVKTPGFSPIKTRLAAEIGQPQAEQLHLRAARATASVVEQLAADRGCRGHWAVAEPEAAAHRAWSGFNTIDQGQGGLGERMGKVHTELVACHGAAILVGADSPQLEAAQLSTALDWLHQPGHRSVLGLAEDGGFWLVGANCPLPATAWNGVEYSTPRTGQDFLQVIGPHAECLRVPPLHDIDRRDDLAATAAALRALAQPTAAQSDLLDWLRKHLQEFRLVTEQQGTRR